MATLPARTAHIGPGFFRFLRDLKRHNDREWFLANKGRYEADVRDPMLRLIAELAPEMRKLNRWFLVDPRPVGGSLFRIYRDTRFSPDKAPYKTHAAAHFPHMSTGKNVHVPGFYLHLEPGLCFAGGGLWHPDADLLRRVRDAIVAKPAAWAAVRRRVGEIEGDALARVPRGYDSDHPHAEDLSRKDFYTSVELTEAQALSPRFAAHVVAAFRAATPLVEFLTKAVDLRW